MRGRGRSFDQKTTDAEFRTIPDRDLADLFKAMGLYAQGRERGYVVKKYGDDLLMVKATNGTAGRCLIFTLDTEEPALLIALLAYKKESDEAPRRVLDAARTRLQRYRDERERR